MAEVLRRNTATYSNVSIAVCDFEQWQPGDRRFGLLLAATCGHWLSPDRRWTLAHAVLAPGGAVALLWNPHGILDSQLHAELDRRHGVVDAPHSDPVAAYGDQLSSRDPQAHLGGAGMPARRPLHRPTLDPLPAGCAL